MWSWYKKSLKLEEARFDNYKQVTGAEKLNCARDFLKNASPKIIADLGGVTDTYAFLHKICPGAAIITINLNKSKTRGCPMHVINDVEQLCINSDSVDLVFAGDIIEHIIDTDLFAKEISRVLKPGGHAIITTPNIAMWTNRLFLLFGWSLGNYHPSMVRHGNPLLSKIPGVHKSVFNINGLKGLFKENGLLAIGVKGYSYATDQNTPAASLRKALNSVLPNGLREGMAMLLEKPGNKNL